MPKISGISQSSTKAKHTFDSLQFPQSLGSPGVDDYCIFYFNEVQSSKFKSTSGSISGITQQNANSYRNTNSIILPTSTSIRPVVGDTVLGSLNTTAPMVRSASAIALPMPDGLKFPYNIDYASVSNELTRLKESSAGDILDVLGAEAKGALASVATGTDVELQKNLALRGKGLAANPHMEQLFQGVSFRDFTFNYKLTPMSEKDCQIIDNIITLFKFHAHPENEENETGRFWKLPSEVEIQFFSGGSENRWIPRIGVCVIKSFECDQMPNGIWATFRNGFPVQVDFSISFQETEILTKEKIIRGY